MIKRSTLLHAKAIAAICVVVTVLYFLTKTDPTATPTVENNHGKAVQIVTATWGKNCNSQLDQMNADLAALPVVKDSQGQIERPAPLKPVATDNALTALKKLCDGRVVCEFHVSDEALGPDPFPRCVKELELAYRCFNVDRTRAIAISQGESLKISCREADLAASAATNTNAPKTP